MRAGGLRPRSQRRRAAAFPRGGGRHSLPAPYAIVTAALLRSRPRRWWILLLAATAGDVLPHRLGGASLAFVLAAEAVNHVRAVLAAIGLRRFAGRVETLREMVAYLLNNAAKYSERRGRIDVTVEQEAGRVRLSVRDQGIGLAPEALERIFELFSQVPAGRTRSRGGLGIGLALVRRLVELHDGTVVARSEGPHKGSELIVTFPAEIPDRPPLLPSTARSADGRGAPLRIPRDDEVEGAGRGSDERRSEGRPPASFVGRGPIGAALSAALVMRCNEQRLDARSALAGSSALGVRIAWSFA